MSAPEVRRLLDDLGSVEPAPPDAEFVDRLEFQLRAEAIALAPDTYDDAPWRLPFGIAAAAFSVVVGVAGITVVRDLPGRHVSAQLTAVTGAEVILPDGTIYVAEAGMTIPEGAILRVMPGQTAEVDGVKLDSAQAVKVIGNGQFEKVDPDAPLAGGTEVAAGDDGGESSGSPTDGAGSGESEVAIAVTVPDTPTTRKPAAAQTSDPLATTGAEATAPAPSSTNPTHDVARPLKGDPVERIGLADGDPGPSSRGQVRSTTDELPTAARRTTTEGPETTTTAVDSTTISSTSIAPSTVGPTKPSTSAPKTTTTAVAPRATEEPRTVDADVTAVTPTTGFGPPGGTTTTTAPVDPDGDDGDPVDPDGDDGDPVDSDSDGDVAPASADEGEPFDGDVASDVTPASTGGGEPLDDTAGGDGSESGPAAADTSGAR